jgi:indole-3-glycerol phosphate synthase
VNALEQIVARTREEVQERKRRVPLGALPDPPARRSFIQPLQRPGVSLIAEHKRSSPSAGVIREDLQLEDVVTAYERGGASALSILTEGPSFGGSLEDLRAARSASSLPILRKDFIVDPYQVHESLAWGADAILLIVAALSPAELVELRGTARERDLAALVEVHDERELDVALQAGAQLIGINNRDLKTLEVDTARTFQLREQIPPGVLVVAESGFRSRAEVDELQAAGVNAVLIGEALMRSPDLEAACRALTLADEAPAPTPPTM